MALHKARHAEADRLWLLHDLPTITHRRDGTYVYNGPETRPSVTHPEERKDMATIGPKERQRRELREANADRPTWKGRLTNKGIPPKSTSPVPPAANPEESTMAKKPTKKTKTTKKTKAKSKRKSAPTIRPSNETAGGDALGGAARPNGLRIGSKQAIMFDMAAAPGGATEEAICAKLGWKKCRVTLKRVCDKVGAVLTQSKNEAGKTVWSATWPASKAA